ncbi:MAG: Fic family protein [Chloroflexi bacterium]|nr:Fic family protein [Chloroflexota bacterium]
MDDPSELAITDISRQIEFLLNEPIDFAATDSDSIRARVRILSAAASYFNVLAVREFGGRGGLARDERLVEQVVAAAFQTFGEHDPHPTPFDKAAMLLRGITQGHPFNDGNKRTGLLLAAYYLDLLGYPAPTPFPDNEVVSFCLRVSAGEIRDVNSIAETLRNWWSDSRG